MKKVLLFLLFAFMLAVLAIFIRPDLLINTKTLGWALTHTKVVKAWSWKEGGIQHQWYKWNERGLRGSFKDLCLELETRSLALDTCVEELSWDFLLVFKWGEDAGLKSLSPLTLKSKKIQIAMKEGPEEGPTSPPDLWAIWQRVWGKFVPDMELDFQEIELNKGGKKYSFDLQLSKKQKTLEAKALDFRLKANPQGLELIAPSKYLVKENLKSVGPFYLNNVRLKAQVREEGIPLEISGALEEAGFSIDSIIDLPLKDDFTSLAFRKNILLKSKAQIVIQSLKASIAKHAPWPFKILPAPLNAMDGEVRIDLLSEDMEGHTSVLVKSNTHVDLKGRKQVLDLLLKLDLPFDLSSFSSSSILAELEFNKVAIQLPRLSKKTLLPRFYPDTRIKRKAKTKRKKKIDLTFDLRAEGPNALALKNNLLDEALRLNFDLSFKEGVKQGYIKALPLKTTVFKRPVLFKHMKIHFNDPEEALLEGTILFLLPVYKINVQVEGPLSSPRYAFTSEPPLPENDIYGVLLFGRPLSELDSEDKTAAQRTNQVLSHGPLSLSVLYLLAGGPVEYIGYDPETERATAQLGIDSKTSVRLGGRSGAGLSSSGVRRSLGKGWYLDTSMEKLPGPNNAEAMNYGLLLERIMAY